jgi:flavin reductase (DIM6/NTAB) family NADH-FMN oxidoreductase RutF
MTMPAALDSGTLRRALGRFATGVAVITARGPDGGPVGLTVNSLASVSLDPPLLAWSLAERSRSLPVFRSGRPLAINVLSEGQEALSRRFAGGSSAERFTGVAWRSGTQGAPLLEGCLATFECVIRRRIRAGDHRLLLCGIERCAWRQDAPLLFFASRYGLPPAPAAAA